MTRLQSNRPVARKPREVVFTTGDVATVIRTNLKRAPAKRAHTRGEIERKPLPQWMIEAFLADKRAAAKAFPDAIAAATIEAREARENAARKRKR